MGSQDLLNALVGGVCAGVDESEVDEFVLGLPENWQAILSKLYGLSGPIMSRTAVADVAGVSPERVRQIEAKALIRLRRSLEEKFQRVSMFVVLESRTKKVPILMPSLTCAEASYVTGFCEGDGSVGTDSSSHVFVSFSQKESDVLEFISSLFPGGNWGQSLKSGVWQLTYHRRESLLCILECLSKHVVGLRNLERYNKVLERLGLPSVTSHTPSLEWLGGFFDAEGTVMWKGPRYGLQIAQKDRSPLDAIAAKFGGIVREPCGSSVCFSWYVGGRTKGFREFVESLYRLSNKFSKRSDLRALMTRLYVANKQRTSSTDTNFLT